MENDLLSNYLRRYRKMMNLTEREVAFLVGLNDGSPISRYENVHTNPSLQTLLRLLALFDCPAQELFPGEYQKAEIDVLERLRMLRRHHDHRTETDPGTAYKVKQLSQRLEEVAWPI